MRNLAIAVVILGALALAVVLLVPRRDEPLANWWIRDDAHVLKPAEELHLTRYHGELLDAWDVDLRILTVPAAADLEMLAVNAFADLGVGARSETGRGLLLVVDPAGGRVRLEVARELEGTYPDAFVSYVEHEQMAPFFAAGRVADGILATTELLVARAGDPHDGLAGRAQPVAATSAGAGASASVPVGSGYERPSSAQTVNPAGADSPEAAVTAYLDAMARRDARPELDLYTPASRELLATRVITIAQMDNVVRTYRGCEGARVVSRDERAVILYAASADGCAPWLLERGVDGLWRLDLATMSESLRFDTRNRWRLADPDSARAYGFAFADG